MGEYIYTLIKEKDDVLYGLEVTTRGILQNAPLHGYIWETISHRFDEHSDPSDIFDFVDNRLCFFKNYSGMAVIYVSCSLLSFLSSFFFYYLLLFIIIYLLLFNY